MGIPDKVLIGKEGITKIVPQREPVLMIDELICSDELRTVTSFQVLENNIFVKNGIMSEYGLIENIAQTAAARSGYVAMETGCAVPLGFIAGIKNLQVFSCPVISDVIETEISIVDNVIGMTIISGQCSCRGKLLAACEMRIFIEQ